MQNQLSQKSWSMKVRYVQSAAPRRVRYPSSTVFHQPTAFCNPTNNYYSSSSLFFPYYNLNYMILSFFRIVNYFFKKISQRNLSENYPENDRRHRGGQCPADKMQMLASLLRQHLHFVRHSPEGAFDALYYPRYFRRVSSNTSKSTGFVRKSWKPASR